MFDDERWYYISDVVETRSIFEREVKERQVITVQFDSRGVVSGVDDFGLERGREVDLVARETPSFGKSVDFLSQVMGNLGRFNNTGSGQTGSGQQRRGSPSPYGRP